MYILISLWNSVYYKEPGSVPVLKASKRTSSKYHHLECSIFNCVSILYVTISKTQHIVVHMLGMYVIILLFPPLLPLGKTMYSESLAHCVVCWAHRVTQQK